ncbi:hypothetical protein T4A_3252 [Trichinella pseudospiralis]|uniref:Uncharacterized protein n=1 Tax=Trichinella pseudospiralis TaxID=6337 RepID=A0A0V1DKK9_TRIPS|nr:hypothetical protein T4A_3252 [Trichinella pseudospiralis]
MKRSLSLFTALSNHRSSLSIVENCNNEEKKK